MEPTLPARDALPPVGDQPVPITPNPDRPVVPPGVPQPTRPGQLPDDPVPTGVPIDDPAPNPEPPMQEPPGAPGAPVRM